MRRIKLQKKGMFSYELLDMLRFAWKHHFLHLHPNKDGVGIKLIKNYFARNCMKYPYLHKKVILAKHPSDGVGNVVGVNLQKRNVCRNCMKWPDLQSQVKFDKIYSFGMVGWGSSYKKEFLIGIA